MSPFYEYRPELNRDGDIVAYTEQAKKNLERAKKGPPDGSMAMIELMPKREYFSALVTLEDWYEFPLKPGHYQLTVRKQFVPDGDYVESNPITFDVVSPKPPESLDRLSPSEEPHLKLMLNDANETYTFGDDVRFKMTYRIIVPVQSQSNQDELARVKESVKEQVSKNMKGWTYKSVEPIQGSQNVIIQQWQQSDIIIKVAISRLEAQADAEAAFKQHKGRLQREEEATSKNRGKTVHLIKEDLSVGDEGFVGDKSGSEVVTFRKGRYLVNVSVPSPANNKDVFFSRKVAHDVAKALE
jgi:hypothetical protein